MANALRGKKISLAVPLLANIYRTLRDLASAKDPSFSGDCIPFHFIHGWLNMHWPNLYTTQMSTTTRSHLPAMHAMAGTLPRIFDDRGARGNFYWSKDDLDKCHARAHLSVLRKYSDCHLTDSESVMRSCPDLYDFLIFIRHGLLPLRIGELIILEPYYPHRCGRQFGYDMHVPVLLPPIPDTYLSYAA